MGVDFDASANREMTGGRAGRITKEGSRLAAWVIPTDEEVLIARDTYRLLSGLEPRY